MDIVPRTWVPGVPRGYGDSKVASEWLRDLERSLSIYRHASDSHDPLRTRYEVTFEFCVDPASRKYSPSKADFKAHGSDLDNLVMQTLNGLSSTRSTRLPPGLRILTDDKAVYRLTATKVHVRGDDEMGVWVEIRIWHALSKGDSTGGRR